MRIQDYIKKHPYSEKEKKRIAKYRKTIQSQLEDFMFFATCSGLLTQERLAKKIGTKQPAIARLVNGNCSPTLKTLEKIANACGGWVKLEFVKNPPKNISFDSTNTETITVTSRLITN